MKIKARCSGCGGAFAAPASLAGQTVKCPKCGAGVSVPKAQPAPPPEPAINDEPDQVRIDFESLASDTSPGATAIGGSGAGKRAKSADPEGHPEEDDLQGRMERLYGLYTSEELVTRRRGKFTIGLGISIAVVLLGVGVGVFVLKNTSQTAQTVTRDHAVPPRDGEASEDRGPKRASIDEAAAAAAVQNPDRDTHWIAPEPGNHSAIRLSGVSIEPQWADRGRLHRFTVRLDPATQNDAKLIDRTEVVLFRSEDETGPYRQVDRTRVEGGSADAGQSVISLMDAAFTAPNVNRVYYRLRGVDGLGKLLFDTPPVAFPVIEQPKVTGNKVTWKPNAPGPDAPRVRCLVYLDAPGWEDVLIGRITGDGEINATLPAPISDAPLRIVMSSAMPRRFESTGANDGEWNVGLVENVIANVGSGGTFAASGITPVTNHGAISYQLIGDEKHFTNVTRTDDAVSFLVQGGAGLETIGLSDPPAPVGLTATPFDHEVRLTWDNAALLGGLDRYEGGVAAAIYRSADGGERRLIGTAPPGVNSFTDANVRDGTTYRYTIALTQAEAPGTEALLRAQAWAAGTGALPVLVKIAPEADTPIVATDASLARLHVAVGRDELAYPDTDRAAIRLHEAITRELLNDDRIAIIDRTGRQTARSGVPAHVLLRLVDASTADGNSVALWATDLVSSTSIMLTETPVDAADEAAVLDALRRYLNPRRRTNPPASTDGAAPRRLVIGPLVPADQTRRFHGSDHLTTELIGALRSKADGIEIAGDPSGDANDATVRIIGRTWINDDGRPGLTMRAIHHRTGSVIGAWRADETGVKTPAAFADWAVTLTVPAGAPASASTSALLDHEISLEPMHPVWRVLAEEETDTPPIIAGTPQRSDRPVLAFGLALPPQLQPMRTPAKRSGTDPLAELRPYTAPGYPMMFEQWVDAYAQYLQDDYAAFKAGIDQARGAAPESAPRIIVRGQEKFVGNEPLTGLGNLNDTPLVLNTRGFLKIGAAGQPLIDYHRELSEFFRDNPWTAYLAWQQMPPALAESFLKAELFGVRGGKLGRARKLTRPPEPHEYVAAKVLADAGNPGATSFQKIALDKSAQALGAVVNRGLTSLNPADQKHVANALCILLIENDPGAVGRLMDPQFRDKFLSAKPGAAADVMRLLVDRVGPDAWTWDNRDGPIAWRQMRWRNPEEMRMVMDAFADALPEDVREQMRAWLDDSANRHTPSPGRVPYNAAP